VHSNVNLARHYRECPAFFRPQCDRCCNQAITRFDPLVQGRYYAKTGNGKGNSISPPPF
jgi:hypothetical protein